ncbi:MAG: MFS transporter, partial [Candidatus Thorarchaeota archaeon]
AIGQVLGLLVLSRLFRSKRSSMLVSGLLLAVFTLATALVQDSVVLTLTRLFEGAGAGLLALLIIRVSCEFESCRGETVGTLLSALFLGSAIGQGIAGIAVENISLLLSLSQLATIQFFGLILSVPFLFVLGLMLPSIEEQPISGKNEGPKEHKHFHFSSFIKVLLTKKVLLLAIIYFLYDFSHGFYTPILSILINNNGIPIDQIGLGYLTGDIVWGGMQLYAGRVVDRIGHLWPLALSLVAKGTIVFFYAGVFSITSLIPLLALAGAAEGFLEPARNDAAMAHSPTNGLTHDHAHYYLVHAPGMSFSLAKHNHEHVHLTGSDEVVSILQTVGLLGFALGAGGGAWMLLEGLSISFLTIVGGTMLILAGLLSMGFRFTGTDDSQ